MLKFEFLYKFVTITKMFFSNAAPSVKANGSQALLFDIIKEVHQEYSLILYLFLTIIKVLNYMIEINVDSDLVQQIVLLIKNK